MSIINDSTINLIQSGMNVSLERQNLLSSNIANLDTPGYTPSDIDFSAALRDASEGDNQGRMSHSHAFERIDRFPGLDGNSVDLDVQMARIAQNAIFYQAETKTIAKKFAMLRYAIQEAG